MPTTETITIATRRSLLALAQANWVGEQLRAMRPGLNVELLEVVSSGDMIQDRLLREIGGKALFVKEVEEALADGRADIAVHSLKDVPTELPTGMTLIAIPHREDPRDVLIVSGPAVELGDLEPGARIGTASMRRSAMLLRARADLDVKPLRGNVNTRLSKLEAGEEFDAIILAAAGLLRLKMDEVERSPLDTQTFVPAAGQGALAIEAPLDRTDLSWITDGLDDIRTRLAVEAERAFLDRLGGSCQIPVGAYASWLDDSLTLSGCVADETGDVIQRELTIDRPGGSDDVAALGHELAERVLLAGGAGVVAHFTDPATGLSAPATQLLVEAAAAHRERSQQTARLDTLAGKRVLVTRSKEQASKLSKLLRDAGAEPVEVPCLELLAVDDDEQARLDDVLTSLDRYDWIVFTSQNGVAASIERLEQLGHGVASLTRARIAAVGSITAEFLKNRGIYPDLIPNTFDAEGLLAALSPQLGAESKVLILRAREARQTLVDGLVGADVEVDAVTCYATGPSPNLPSILAAALKEPLDVLTFASSKTVKYLLEAAGESAEALRSIPAACIGPVTRKTATALGFDVVAQPLSFTIDALVWSIAEWAAFER